MRKILLGALSAVAIGVFAFFAQTFLFPFIYKIKEPFFVIPIQLELGKNIKDIQDLPIRNDGHGEGRFGAKRNGKRRHLGLDIAAETQTPVYASKSGRARAGFIPNGYGNLVIITHPGGWETRYGHLYDYTIKNRSQWVRQGDIIGHVGKTGNAGSKNIIPHLHFEIHYKGTPVDPAGELVKTRRVTIEKVVE